MVRFGFKMRSLRPQQKPNSGEVNQWMGNVKRCLLKITVRRYLKQRRLSPLGSRRNSISYGLLNKVNAVAAHSVATRSRSEHHFRNSQIFHPQEREKIWIVFTPAMTQMTIVCAWEKKYIYFCYFLWKIGTGTIEMGVSQSKNAPSEPILKKPTQKSGRLIPQGGAREAPVQTAGR